MVFGKLTSLINGCCSSVFAHLVCGTSAKYSYYSSVVIMPNASASARQTAIQPVGVSLSKGNHAAPLKQIANCAFKSSIPLSSHNTTIFPAFPHLKSIVAPLLKLTDIILHNSAFYLLQLKLFYLRNFE